VKRKSEKAQVSSLKHSSEWKKKSGKYWTAWKVQGEEMSGGGGLSSRKCLFLSSGKGGGGFFGVAKKRELGLLRSRLEERRKGGVLEEWTG